LGVGVVQTFQRGTHVHTDQTGSRGRVVGSSPRRVLGREPRRRNLRSGGLHLGAHRCGARDGEDCRPGRPGHERGQVAECALSGSGSVAGVGIDGKVDSKRAEELRERRQFLSRLTRTASFADAANHEFGWNFYPTNLTTVRRSILNQLGNFVTFQSRSPIQVNATLEGGARDCAAWLIVPTQLEWIECEIYHVVASVDPVALDRNERRYCWADRDHESPVRIESGAAGECSPKRVRIHLPTWNDSEADAFFARPDAPSIVPSDSANSSVGSSVSSGALP